MQNYLKKKENKTKKKRKRSRRLHGGVENDDTRVRSARMVQQLCEFISPSIMELILSSRMFPFFFWINKSYHCRYQNEIFRFAQMRSVTRAHNCLCSVFYNRGALEQRTASKR